MVEIQSFFRSRGCISSWNLEEPEDFKSCGEFFSITSDLLGLRVERFPTVLWVQGSNLEFSMSSTASFNPWSQLTFALLPPQLSCKLVEGQQHDLFSIIIPFHTWWVFVNFYCCCSVAKTRPSLCDPMNHSTPGFPFFYSLLEFAQSHVHWVGDAIEPSHPLSLPSLMSYG